MTLLSALLISVAGAMDRRADGNDEARNKRLPDPSKPTIKEAIEGPVCQMRSGSAYAAGSEIAGQNLTLALSGIFKPPGDLA